MCIFWGVEGGGRQRKSKAHGHKFTRIKYLPGYLMSRPLLFAPSLHQINFPTGFACIYSFTKRKLIYIGAKIFNDKIPSIKVRSEFLRENFKFLTAGALGFTGPHVTSSDNRVLWVTHVQPEG